MIYCLPRFQSLRNEYDPPFDGISMCQIGICQELTSHKGFPTGLEATLFTASIAKFCMAGPHGALGPYDRQ
jgi:hypothetical protein